jgi:hypothetical protein
VIDAMRREAVAIGIEGTPAAPAGG